MHDENGNVDPVKASETPVARGSGASRKRPLMPDVATPIQSKRPKSDSAGADMSPVPVFAQQQASPILQAHQLHAPSNGESYQAHISEAQIAAPNGHTYPQHHQLEQHGGHAPMDPIFTYPASTDNGSYGASNYSYPTTEKPHLYQIQSLEQIASEVLDMNADYQDEAQSSSKEIGSAPVPHGYMDAPDADESVDSGVSLPGSENMENNGTYSQKQDAADMTNEQSAALAAYQVPDHDDAKAAPRPVAEPSTERADAIDVQASPSAQHNGTSSLPLYRPPAPLSQSPEQSKRLPNGTAPESPAQTNGHKRKRSSMSQTSGSKHQDLAQALQQQNGLGVQSG